MGGFAAPTPGLFGAEMTDMLRMQFPGQVQPQGTPPEGGTTPPPELQAGNASQGRPAAPQAPPGGSPAPTPPPAAGTPPAAPQGPYGAPQNTAETGWLGQQMGAFQQAPATVNPMTAPVMNHVQGDPSLQRMLMSLYGMGPAGQEMVNSMTGVR